MGRPHTEHIIVKGGAELPTGGSVVVIQQHCLRFVFLLISSV